MQFSARTYAVNRVIQWSFYLLNTHTICAIFLYIWTQCIDGFILLLQRYIRKGNNAKNPAILSFFSVTKRTQLNAAHAQLLEKLRPIAFAETSRFLTIQSLEFQEMWQQNSSETTWMIYHKKSEFWHREFLIIQNMQWKRFTVNYENRLCQNFIRTVLTEGI